MTLLCLCQGVSGEKQETYLSVTVQPEDPPMGTAFTVTGNLTGAEGNPLGNKRVILQSSPDGNPAYPFEQIMVSSTDRSGSFSFYRGNYTPTEYIRVAFLGSTEYIASFTDAVMVHNSGHNKTGVHPSRATGGIMITGKPDKSQIYLDGELRGETPLALNGISEGAHILEIGSPGYQNQTMEIFIAPERQTTFNFHLPPAGLNLANAGFESATGLHVYSNTSYGEDSLMPPGDPIYSFNRAGMSVEIYGNESFQNGTNKARITTLYDEHPFGDGYSMSVIITSDDTPFR